MRAARLTFFFVAAAAAAGIAPACGGKKAGLAPPADGASFEDAGAGLPDAPAAEASSEGGARGCARAVASGAPFGAAGIPSDGAGVAAVNDTLVAFSVSGARCSDRRVGQACIYLFDGKLYSRVGAKPAGDDVSGDFSTPLDTYSLARSPRTGRIAAVLKREFRNYLIATHDGSASGAIGTPAGWYKPADAASGPRPSAIAYDGERLHVAASFNQRGLSVSFVDEPGPTPQSMTPTDLVVPEVVAFHAVAAHPSGGVFLAGLTASGAVKIARVTPANVIDTSWGSAGFASVTSDAGPRYDGAGIALDSIGRIVVVYAGKSAKQTIVTRLLPTGAPDPSFAPLTLPLSSPWGERIDVGVDLDDAIYVPGLLPPVTTEPTLGAYARVLPDGTLDRTIGAAGIVAEPPAPQFFNRPTRALLSLSPNARSCQGALYLYVVDGSAGRLHNFRP